jgi:hypothetical protein
VIVQIRPPREVVRSALRSSRWARKANAQSKTVRIR